MGWDRKGSTVACQVPRAASKQSGAYLSLLQLADLLLQLLDLALQLGCGGLCRLVLHGSISAELRLLLLSPLDALTQRDQLVAELALLHGSISAELRVLCFEPRQDLFQFSSRLLGLHRSFLQALDRLLGNGAREPTSFQTGKQTGGRRQRDRHARAAALWCSACLRVRAVTGGGTATSAAAQHARKTP